MPKKPDIYAGKSPRELPLYSILEAARIVRVRPTTVRAWALGRMYTTSQGAKARPPVIHAADPEGRRLSFANLVELLVLSALRGGRFVNGSTSNVTLRPLVERYLDRIDRDEQGLASRLFPITRDDAECPRAVVIDPARRFGRPILASANIETSVIAERFFAGESPASLASDFQVPENDILEAVRFESRLRAA